MQTTPYSIPLHFDHDISIHQIGENPKRIFLLLHGYLLDGKFILEQFRDIFPKDSLIIAPDGPFPVPIKKKERYFMKFAWYFFDPLIKNYYINFEPGAEYAKKCLEKFPTLPTTVIGYSQGGYISPKVAEVCEQVDSVIGLCATFRTNRFSQRDIPYYQINSAIDKIVDIETSKEEFDKLKNNSGEFIVMENAVHKIGPEHKSTLKLLLEKHFSK